MGKIDFSLDAIFLIGKWNYDTTNEDCSLCRTSLTMPPPGGNIQDANVVEGRCGHAFHESCINKWKAEGIKNKKNTACPEDNSEFIVKKRYHDDPNWDASIPRITE